MPKKVLHVISGLGTGGAERALYNILWGSIGNKFENEVVSLSGGGDLADAISRLDIPVHVLNMSLGGALPRALINLKRLTSEFKPDLIQGWMYHGNLAATVVSMAVPFKPKTVWNVRHSLYSLTDEKRLTQYVIRANRLFSRKANAIIYNSYLSRKQHEEFGLESSNGLVIPARARDLAREWSRSVSSSLGEEGVFNSGRSSCGRSRCALSSNEGPCVISESRGSSGGEVSLCVFPACRP